MAKLTKLTKLQEKALKVLIRGGTIEYKLEKAGRYGTYEQFRYRLKNERGAIVKGFAHAALSPLSDDSRFVERDFDAMSGSSWREVYRIKPEFRAAA